MDRTSVLVVDDERGVREAIRESLTEDFTVIDSKSGEEALEKIEKNKVDLVLLDINLPGMDGIETLKSIRKYDSKLPVIMVSVIDGIKTVVNAMKSGANDYVNKPFDVDGIKLVVQSVLRRYNGLEDKSNLPAGIQAIIDESVREMKSKNASLKEATNSFSKEIRNIFVDKAN